LIKEAVVREGMSDSPAPLATSWSKFKRWLFEERATVDNHGKPKTQSLAVRKRERVAASSITHLLLDGGRLVVPGNMSVMFLQRYAQALVIGEHLYMVERKTEPFFKFMCELDIKLLPGAVLSREDIDKIVFVIQSGVVSRVYDESQCECYVCTVEPKILKDGGQQFGLHLIWPDIIVERCACWMLRSSMVRLCEKFAVSVPIIGTWQDAFDPRIYCENGLRMIGSRKAEHKHCNACQGRYFDLPNGHCDSCNDIVYVDNGRPYSLLYVAGKDGSMLYPASRVGMNDVVIKTSIRVIGPDVKPTKMSIEEMIENFPDMAADSTTDKVLFNVALRKRPAMPSSSTTTRTKKPKPTMDDSCLEEITSGHPMFAAIESTLSKFPGNPTLSHVRMNKKAHVIFANTRSHYCDNKKGEHSHSYSWFHISISGIITQRCFSPKSTNGVACSSFISWPRFIAPDALISMFGIELYQSTRPQALRDVTAIASLTNAPVVVRMMSRVIRDNIVSEIKMIEDRK
jgi:hypothetical protein